jgi:hypothetical protein
VYHFWACHSAIYLLNSIHQNFFFYQNPKFKNLIYYILQLIQSIYNSIHTIEFQGPLRPNASSWILQPVSPQCSRLAALRWSDLYSSAFLLGAPQAEAEVPPNHSVLPQQLRCLLLLRQSWRWSQRVRGGTGMESMDYIWKSHSLSSLVCYIPLWTIFGTPAQVYGLYSAQVYGLYLELPLPLLVCMDSHSLSSLVGLHRKSEFSWTTQRGNFVRENDYASANVYHSREVLWTFEHELWKLY